MMPCNQLILCCTLLVPSIFPSIRVFFSEPACAIWWSMYWRFTLSFSPSNEYSGLISFRMDWFDFLAIQVSLKVFSNTKVQNMNSSVLSFLHSPTITSIHDYWKNHSFDCMEFVGKAMSLLFSMLSRVVKAFLLRSKRHLIPWLQSPSAVILEPKKIKFVTVSIVSPSICHEVLGPDAIILFFEC